jgi:hypothetical protein
MTPFVMTSSRVYRSLYGNGCICHNGIKSDSLFSEYINISAFLVTGKRKIFARRADIKQSKMPEFATRELEFCSFGKGKLQFEINININENHRIKVRN